MFFRIFVLFVFVAVVAATANHEKSLNSHPKPPAGSYMLSKEEATVGSAVDVKVDSFNLYILIVVTHA